MDTGAEFESETTKATELENSAPGSPRESSNGAENGSAHPVVEYQDRNREIPASEISRVIITHIINDRPGIMKFYGKKEELEGIFDPEKVKEGSVLQRAVTAANHFRTKGYKYEVSCQLSLLVLYDLVILADNSVSMEIQQGGKRIKTLTKIMQLIANTYHTASSNKEGITSIQFFNDIKVQRKILDIKNLKPWSVEKMMERVRYNGLTAIGNALQRKVLKQFVTENMRKPLIIVIITDGEIEGEPEGYLKRVITEQASDLQNINGDYGHQAVGYQFAKLGNDKSAIDLVKMLDDDRDLGDHIDCMLTELEEFEANIDKDRKGMLLGKLLLGPVTEFFDELDPDNLKTAEVEEPMKTVTSKPDDNFVDDLISLNQAEEAPEGWEEND